jgi:hypothetical protein
MKRKDYITETKSIEHMDTLLDKLLFQNPKDNYYFMFEVPMYLWPSVPAINKFLLSLTDGSIVDGSTLLYDINLRIHNDNEYKLDNPGLVPNKYLNSYIKKLAGHDLNAFLQELTRGEGLSDYRPNLGTRMIAWGMLLKDRHAFDLYIDWLVSSIVEYHGINYLLYVPNSVLKQISVEQAGALYTEIARKYAYASQTFQTGTSATDLYTQKIDIIVAKSGNAPI